MDHLGALMPLLSELRLERGSTLASFRDLGSSLANLRVVWFPACGIRHLDGVGALSSLEELYLAFNDVEDLTSIALHDRLEVQGRATRSVVDLSAVWLMVLFFWCARHQGFSLDTFLQTSFILLVRVLFVFVS